MRGVFSFITAFCLGGIALGALYVLLPEGAMKKPVKYVFCVCFLCIILSSFPLSFDIDTSPDLSVTNTSVENANASAAKLTIQKALQNAGLSFSKVIIFPQTDANGNIVSINAEVYTKESEDKIKSVIESENIKVSVIYE